MAVVIIEPLAEEEEELFGVAADCDTLVDILFEE